MSNLPVELITELFIRLPVKSLLRFRSVSKQWRGLIDSQDFIKAHLNWSLTATHNKQRLILGSLGMLHYSDLDFAEDGGVKVLDTPFTSFTWLWGSCNGLVLLQSDDNICILNPSTKRYVNLPYCPVEYTDLEINENYGLGYDLKNDDYKVVKIMEFRDEVGEWVRSETWVYSSNLASWQRILDFPYRLPENRPVWGAFVEGVLHANLLENQEFILGFDLSSEDYNFVPLPESLDKNIGGMQVMILGDFLCLLGGSTHHPHRTDVWVMNKYGVKESWTKLFSIAPPIVKPYLSIHPLAYSGDGTEVLMIYGNARLIWYNMKRQTVRDACVQNLPWNFYTDVFVDSLVSLPGFDVTNTQIKAGTNWGRRRYMNGKHMLVE